MDLKWNNIVYRATILVLCLLFTAIMSGCTIFKHNGFSSGNATGPAPTAQQLIATFQQHFRSVTSFHMMMQVQNVGPANPNQVQILNTNGDVVMPDKVKAQATVVLSGQNVQVSLISINGNQYVTDPITGQWRVMNGIVNPNALTNPDTGIVSIFGKVQNLSQPVGSNANGTPCWSVNGTLDAQNLASFTGGGAPAGSQLQVSACFGQNDSLPYHIKIVGEAASGDTPQTTRTFDLSDYNKPVTINAPQI
jgi:LppX_LprAFG lipoprotein